MSVVAVMLIIENILAVKQFSMIKTINFQSCLFFIIVLSHRIVTKHIMSYLIVPQTTPLTVMIWINLGRDKHQAELRSVAICQYGLMGYKDL